jgi:GNAT superfamily N-acetyltransferase
MLITLYEQRQDDFLVSTDPDLLQLDAIEAMLAGAYWAQGRPRHLILRSIQNSLCFGAYKDGLQVGFARLVTDYTTYAWLCDVIVQQAYRGAGLGKFMMRCVMSHPELKNLRRWSLATRDAHEFYRPFGFHEIESPQRFMEIFNRGD